MKNWFCCFIFFDPHVRLCTLRSKNIKRLALVQIKRVYSFFVYLEYA
ncbi:hypothetical protein BTU51_0164 [Rickettsia rickettsii]|uniref:Uncharacterized protein n=1 Tax=Rickettsia rickettsii (strain Iowa) TaxID=452659 RepID=B0BW57_RICRO|nr:hypothetical protein RrIowa_0164 [Rickettsia rickettsii str. Iowa]APU55035.1 hypothetical protein BTU50_0164 [Rickettsia rickettsii]APU56412.1 hypothetical protein BTU51_0164 [Rickettsia rickettsii]